MSAPVALVTGGSGGLGSAIRARLAEDGWTAVSGDLVAPADGRAALTLDVTDPRSWAAAVQDALDRYGRIDGLVNNAGILGPGAVDGLEPDAFDRVVAVNQRGCFLGMQAVAGPMSDGGGGAIVNIGSVAGLGGAAGLFAYTTTKWAVRGMTRSAALDLAPRGIRVNAVLPGTVAAGLAADVHDESRARAIRTLPLGRQARPGEVADAVAFLLGAGSTYLTGAELVVDGGLSAVVPMPSSAR